KPELMFVLDEIEGDRIEAEQFWHPGQAVTVGQPGCFRIGQTGMLILDLSGDEPELSEGGEFGWRSAAYGSKEAAPLIVSRRKGEGTLRMGAGLSFDASASDATLMLNAAEDSREMLLEGSLQVSVKFPSSGMPRMSGR